MAYQHNIPNTYDDYAAEYPALMAGRGAQRLADDPIMPRLLDLLGDISGLAVLDAGCGEGYLARILAGRGARVNGIDISPRLIELARARDPEGAIEYRVADLSAPLPEYDRRFDLIASHLVLNDVPDHRGFIATLGAVLKPGGRLVVAMNNPYSYVVRRHVVDYFAPGAYPYRGMAAQGVRVHFYQRTLEEYLDAFLAAGFRLGKLVDVPTPEPVLNNPHLDRLEPRGYQFPYFMILSFTKH